MSGVNTSIPGLDELIEGGFVENDVILITGGTGSGKTTFGIQYLMGGIIDYNEPGIYVTMEETPVRVIRNMWRFGWDMEQMVRENMLKIIQLNPVQYKDFVRQDKHHAAIRLDTEGHMLENMMDQLQSTIHEINAKRLFIDSITSFKVNPEESIVRFRIMELIKNLENLDCTTLASSEIIEYDGKFTVEEYLCQGVIKLHVFRVAGNRERVIEILKMRGIKHDELLHPYSITNTGIVVYPSDTVIFNEENIINF
jgi:KaiC/GvpD/RAD55 family RecA-like ATPase